MSGFAFEMKRVVVPNYPKFLHPYHGVCVRVCFFFSSLVFMGFFVSLLTLHSPMYQKSSIIRQCASVCEFVEFLAVCAYTPVVSVCMCVLFASFLWNEHLSRHHLPSLLSRTRSNTLTSEPNQREHTTQLGWLFFLLSSARRLHCTSPSLCPIR